MHKAHLVFWDTSISVRMPDSNFTATMVISGIFEGIKFKEMTNRSALLKPVKSLLMAVLSVDRPGEGRFYSVDFT
jgi:hypothetical protein